MPSKKIVCLGGGSLYFRDVLADLMTKEGLKGSEIVLYDIDIERAELMAKCGRRLSDLAGANFKIYAAKNLTEAIDRADFVIANIGGAGGEGGSYYESKVHTQDLLISARYGIFQVVGDTAGPAAMMAGFRSIPIYLNICREMEKCCPNAILINHANPMAILCRAMNKYTNLRSIIGICHGVQAGIEYIAKILETPPQELDVTWIGTNHYYWFTKIYHKGKNIYPELRKRTLSLEPDKDKILSTKLSQIYGYQITYPEDDHIIEFYPFLAQVKDGAHLPYNLAQSHHGKNVTEMYAQHGLGGKPRRKITEKKPTRKTILKEFRDFLNKATLPKKDEDWLRGEDVGRLIEAIARGERHIHIVNIPNRGVVSNLPDTAVLEMEGVTDSHGIRGIHIGEAPLALRGLLQKIIAWQELVVDAGVKGDKNLALQALMLDEMAILPEKAEAMLEELLANSKKFLPQFKGI